MRIQKSVRQKDYVSCKEIVREEDTGIVTFLKNFYSFNKSVIKMGCIAALGL